MKEKKLAVLIDGDNAENTLLEKIFEELGCFGRIIIKRVYGDFSSPHMGRWRDAVNKFALQPILAFAYTPGKNSTDIALIIDAMDLIHSNEVDGLCLLSSDSDFSGLAKRARAKGLSVIGIGRKQTPESLIKACDEFIFTENLKELNEGGENSQNSSDKNPIFHIEVEKLKGLTVLGKINGRDLDRLTKSKKRRKGKRVKENRIPDINSINNNDLQMTIN